MPWSCPGFEQTCVQSPLAKLSTGQQLSLMTVLSFCQNRPNKILTKHRSQQRLGVVLYLVKGAEQCAGRRSTWVVPTLHPPLWGTKQAHLSRGWDTAASRSCRHYSAADFTLFPPPFPKQLFEGRSWEQLKLAVRDQSHPPTHYKSGSHHAIRLF